MLRMKHALAVSLAVAGVALGGVTMAEAKTCVTKYTKGTSFDEPGAKFQAWEAVLQATDWGSWATFMATGAKPGTAPGYAVSKVKYKCDKGGWGVECKAQATLCK